VKWTQQRRWVVCKWLWRGIKVVDAVFLSTMKLEKKTREVGKNDVVWLLQMTVTRLQADTLMLQMKVTACGCGSDGPWARITARCGVDLLEPTICWVGGNDDWFSTILGILGRKFQLPQPLPAGSPSPSSRGSSQNDHSVQTKSSSITHAYTTSLQHWERSWLRSFLDCNPCPAHIK